MQAAQQSDQERLKMNREYFESGCTCILTTKSLQACPANTGDADAIAFYEQNCKCSRNYQAG